MHYMQENLGDGKKITRQRQKDDVYASKGGKVTKVVTGNSWCDYSQSSFDTAFSFVLYFAVDLVRRLYMKKAMWLLLAFGVALSVVGCDKRSDESIDSVGMELERVESTSNGNGMNSKHEQTLGTYENAIGVSSNVNTNTQSNYVYSYGKDLGYKLYREQFPVFNDDAVYYHHYEGTYNDFEISFIETLSENYQGIKINNSNYEDMSFTGTQTIPIGNGKSLVYDFKFKLNEDIGLFQCLYYRIVNREDIFDEVNNVYEQQIETELLEMEKDKNSSHLISIFEDHINKTNKNKNDDPIEVLNYVKGNFTNSQYDEYIVFFKQGASYDEYGFEVEEDHIKYAECIIVSDGDIVQSYSISGLYGDIGVDEYYNDTLGSKFFQGYVGDFNKNGINELLINCYIKNSRTDTTHMIEFCNDHFETYVFLADSFSKNCLTYDFSKEIFLYEYSISRHIWAGYNWTQGFAWSEKE